MRLTATKARPTTTTAPATAPVAFPAKPPPPEEQTPSVLVSSPVHTRHAPPSQPESAGHHRHTPLSRAPPAAHEDAHSTLPPAALGTLLSEHSAARFSSSSVSAFPVAPMRALFSGE